MLRLAMGKPVNELALFAGAGGGILGGKQLGWQTVCAVELSAYAAAVLAQRQDEGVLEAFPIWSDVCTFDGRPWRGVVDVVSGGFPCQDISLAGTGAGISGHRSGLWREFARIIGEVLPTFVFVENSPALVTRGLHVVLSDLAALGYLCRWQVLGAADLGAPHQRDRFWLVGAHTAGRRGHGRRAADSEAQSRASLSPLAGLGAGQSGQSEYTGPVSEFTGWESEPDVGRVVDGLANRVDRLTALGNGQVPQCAARAWNLLTGVEHA